MRCTLAGLRKIFAREFSLMENSRGNIIFQVVGVFSVLSVAFYFMSGRLVQQKSVVLKNDTILHVRNALNSVLDYTMFGIRQHACFDKNLLPDANCNLSHPASTERVLMPDDQLDVVKKLIQGGVNIGPVDPANIRLPSLEIFLPIANLIGNHPLNFVLQKVKGDLKDAYILVSVKRDDSATVSHTGNEVFFRIDVSFTTSSKKVLAVGRAPLAMSSYGTIYQRELGTFALVVPNDLWLTQPGGTAGTAKPGDVVLTPGVNRQDFGPGRGLKFLSPVYVNHNVHLPVPDYQKGGHQGGPNALFSPVTFSDRVVLGDGAIMEGPALYKPATAGAPGERMWSENKLFGGFKRGVQIDGNFDKGLEYYSTGSSQPISSQLAAKCIARLKAQTDATVLSQSSLYGHQKSAVGGATVTRIGIDNYDDFVKQDNSLLTVTGANWGRGTTSRDPQSDSPTVSLEVQIGDRSQMAQMVVPGTLILSPEVGSDTYLNGLNSELTAARALSPPNQAAVDLADGNLKAFLKKRDELKPKLTIKIDRVLLNGSGPQPHLLDLTTTVENPDSFIDSLGQIAPPRIGITAFDHTYFHGSPQNPPGNPKLTAWLQYNALSGGGLEASQLLTNGALSSTTIGIDESVEDLYDLDLTCKNLRSSSGSQAFGGSNWDRDFSNDYYYAWNFVPSDSAHGIPGEVDTANLALQEKHRFDELTFDNHNAVMGVFNGPESLRVFSIVDICRIKASAEIVAGFLTCNNLIIEARPVNYSKPPLRIIGTIIAKNVSIAKSALQQGIEWSSIYEPQATLELREVGILKSMSGRPCNTPPLDASGQPVPVWHPIPSMQQVSDRFACSTITLRARANPFQWTTVDPDCGRVQASSTVPSCKKHPVRFLVVEHGRGGGP